MHSLALSLGLWPLGLRMVAAAGWPSCDHPVLLNFSLLCTCTWGVSL